MVKLRWLQVNKFRTVKPGTRLTFNPGYNVLLGQNGTGKTTLLNLVAAAVKSDFEDFAEIEFDLTYELSSEDGTATFRVRNERRDPSFQATLDAISQAVLNANAMPPDAQAHAPTFFVDVKFSLKTSATPLVLRAEGSRLSISPGDYGSTDLLVDFNPPPGMSRAPRVMVAFGMIRVSQKLNWEVQTLAPFFRFLSETDLVRFDESLEQFGKLREFSTRIVRENKKPLTVSGLNGPHEFTTPISSLTQANWGAARYILHQSQLPFLQKTGDLLNFTNAEAILELQKTSADADSATMELGNLKFLFTLPNGQKIVERDLSYGQKRMLAFMYYLATVSSVAIADELVNGLHHSWIRACIEALGQRQAFLTSQNPLLLDYLSFQSPEEVRSAFVLCRWEKSPEQMVWENMSQEAAADFFDSYKVGFQQVGELLQSKGLW